MEMRGGGTDDSLLFDQTELYVPELLLKLNRAWSD
jgi:hypothetical protein